MYLAVAVRFLFSIFLWSLYTTLYVALILIGHLIIPPLLLLRAYGPYFSPRYAQNYLGFKPKWLFYLWSNEGDGLFPPEYQSRFPQWSFFRRAWMWTAVRNPVNNLRFVPFLNCKIDPKKVRWVGSLGQNPDLYEPKEKRTYWYFCWCGPYSNYRRVYLSGGRLKEFWIGWKIWPSDINGVSEFRKHRAGFTLQWRYL